jgi:hypothetical protein
MLPPKIGNLPTHHGQVGLRFGIYAGDRLLGAHHEAARNYGMKNVLQQLHKETVKGRLRHLVIDEAVEQFSPFRDQPGIGQRVISLDG